MINSKLNDLNKLKHQLNLIVEGENNLSTDRPVIIISNHNCLKDIFYLPLIFSREIVSLISSRLIYKQDFERQKVVNKYLNSMPVEAHGGKIYSDICLDHATRILCNQIDLNIFPEGAYIDDKNTVYKGRTGVARILYYARDKGVKASLIPVAINVKQNDDNLDSYKLSNNDDINIKILKPINYDEYYYNYKHSNTYEEKNKFLHMVVDEGMKNIAIAQKKQYCDNYIELFPKGNVIFENGEKINFEDDQKDEYIIKYYKELHKRCKVLEKNLIFNKK